MVIFVVYPMTMMETAINTKENTVNGLADFLTRSGWTGFALAVAAGLVNIWIVQEYVLTEAVYYNTLGERMAAERIGEMLSAQDRWQWVSYVLVPVLLLMQGFLVSLCILAGAVALYWKLPFRRLFGRVMQVLGITAVLRLIPTAVLLFKDVRVLEDALYSDWYSLLGVLGRDTVPEWLHAPLLGLNLFHLIFVLLLTLAVWLLRQDSTTTWRWGRTLRFVLATYGSGILLWWLVLVFLQVNGATV